jgi:exopolyphosphatase/guanosine-5'-triphosphate,3'-diphosphate pyrophosphatase
VELRGIRRRLKQMGWKESFGTSGTVNAISHLLTVNDLGGPEITLPRLKKLRKLLVQAEHTDWLAQLGVRPDRAPVLPGGLAILTAVFKSLKIESMESSPGALREGVLYDLLGRMRRADVREPTIRGFVERYGVDEAQASRVERTALGLLEQVADSLGEHAELARLHLTWASRLHEIGLAVSYAGFHRHGAYLVSHADMPGFSRDGQGLLAALIRSHRRKLSLSSFDHLPTWRADLALKLSVLLRLAVLLTRNRSRELIPMIAASKSWKRVTVELPEGWLADHPLTTADLEIEAGRLRAAGVRLDVREISTEGAAKEAESG